MRATCPAHHILLDLITLIILGEAYNLRGSPICRGPKWHCFTCRQKFAMFYAPQYLQLFYLDISEHFRAVTLPGAKMCRKHQSYHEY
jgi:hypothetical protein